MSDDVRVATVRTRCFNPIIDEPWINKSWYLQRLSTEASEACIDNTYVDDDGVEGYDFHRMFGIIIDDVGREHSVSNLQAGSIYPVNTQPAPPSTAIGDQWTIPKQWDQLKKRQLLDIPATVSSQEVSRHHFSTLVVVQSSHSAGQSRIFPPRPRPQSSRRRRAPASGACNWHKQQVPLSRGSRSYRTN